MLSLAALAFSLSAVSVLGQDGGGASRWIAVPLALAAAGSAVAGFGVLQGLIVSLVLAMTAASVLVLVLAPRPERARAVALVSGLVGLVPVMIAGVSR
ncbi:hypothetical protein CYFUS_007555 [Cystobacter fuscus]|uniref:Uncharacterized protein n=1 Tax=Cystobacter fuscus TaxID=43 RepID=A0A250JER8_9BACT|nr:hypothetical protein [Cystobacter fuscus]ATB42078.1 hypothetical protein CYFUS_007555 [Cystobacter fuscus]